jgi:hypothetical protein
VTVSAVEIRYATTSSLVDRSAFGKESDFGQLTKLYSKRWNKRGDLSKRIGLYNFVFHTYYNNQVIKERFKAAVFEHSPLPKLPEIVRRTLAAKRTWIQPCVGERLCWTMRGRAARVFFG